MADFIFFGFMRRHFVMVFTLCSATHAMSQTVHGADAYPNKLYISEAAHNEKQVRGFVQSGQFEEAEAILNQSLQWPYQHASLSLLRLRAELYNRKHNFVDEAATYHDILQLKPNDKEALRGRAIAMLRMGAPHLAVKYAKRRPEVFTRDELLNFHQASAGRSIKWGGVEEKAGVGQQRFQSTDKALIKNEVVRTLLSQAHEKNSRSSHYADFDRIVALRDRVRMQEAIALYQNLKDRQINIPAYALAAVADAYLYQRQPEQARDLYLQALGLNNQDRDYPNREWQLHLFNAYIDEFDFDAARELIDKLVADIPPVLNKGLRGVEVDNEFYEEARINQVIARINADQYEEGQALLDKAFETAPFNLGTRTAYADLLQLRQQPRAAQRQYASVLVDDPTNSTAATGIAETAIALNDSQTAKHHLATLTQHYLENREVQRVQRLYHLYQQPLLTVTSGWGNSPTGGGNRGTQNWQVDTMLHSPLLNQQWRMFVHTFNAEADFNDTTGIRRRVGVGADYRSPAWRISGEVNQDQTRLNNYGVSLNVAWLPDDHWGVDLEFESNSNNIPLQASAAGIDMKSLKLGVDYIANESRSLRANVAYSWLSDGNRRLEAGANWQERWWSGSIYKLETTFGVFASDNSLTDAAYFNPRQDLSVEAQINNEWTVWRDYQRSFKNRLVLGAGNYWQKGFASGMTSVVRYEHEWNLDPYRTISYGAAYERHPYDGVTNETTLVFLNLTWHL
jgi:biofilm PGA synthesis protein PgaA